MFEPQEGTPQFEHKFQKEYNWLETNGSLELNTKSGTRIVAKADITQKGPHTGERVIRFMQGNKEYARAYECCWGRY